MTSLKLFSRGIKYVAGYDIGGTGTTLCVYPVISGRVSDKPVYSLEEPTNKALKDLSAQVPGMLAKANGIDKVRGNIVGVGIGMPGRFDKKGRIKKGSCPPLGVPLRVEFDGVNPQEHFSAALKKHGFDVPVIIGNDATAMLFGLISAIKSGAIKDLKDIYGKPVTKTRLMNEDVYVGLFGIGTGLGHAIVKFAKDGTITPITDGHASKIKLKVDDVDWGRVVNAKKLVKAHNKLVPQEKRIPEFDIFPKLQRVKAENLISGPGIAALCGLTDGKQVSVGNPAHREVVELSAKYTARLIRAIYRGKNKDVVPENGWSEKEKKEAQKTMYYLFGGGFLNCPEGKYLMSQLKIEMKKLADKREHSDNFAFGDISVTAIYKADVAAAWAAAAQLPENVLKVGRAK